MLKRSTPIINDDPLAVLRELVAATVDEEVSCRASTRSEWEAIQSRYQTAWERAYVMVGGRPKSDVGLVAGR